MPLKLAQYSTQLPYQIADRTTMIGAINRASLSENFSSRKTKSAIKANTGARCKERSIWTGMKYIATSEEDDSAFGSFCTIDLGRKKIRVQYIDDMTTANWSIDMSIDVLRIIVTKSYR